MKNLTTVELTMQPDQAQSRPTEAKNNVKTNDQAGNTFNDKMTRKLCWLLFFICGSFIFYVVILAKTWFIPSYWAVALTFFIFCAIFYFCKEHIVYYIVHSHNLFEFSYQFPPFIQSKPFLRDICSMWLRISGDVNLDEDPEMFTTRVVREGFAHV